MVTVDYRLTGATDRHALACDTGELSEAEVLVTFGTNHLRLYIQLMDQFEDDFTVTAWTEPCNVLLLQENHYEDAAVRDLLELAATMGFVQFGVSA